MPARAKARIGWRWSTPQGLGGHAAQRQPCARAVREGRRGRAITRAQINLGILYLRGQGTPRDLVQARAWLEKAAAGGDPQALYALGRAMDESAGQAVADPVRAADLYRRAAEKGHAARRRCATAWR